MPSPFQFGQQVATQPPKSTTPPTAADFLSPKPATAPAPAPAQTPKSFGQQVGNALSGAANSAIQSPLGQKALGGVSHAYNNYMPQAGKDFVARQMPFYVEPDEADFASRHGESIKNTTPTPYKPLGWEHGTHVDSQDTLTTTSGNGQHTENLDSRIDTNTPARVTGSPLQQLGFGLRNRSMPGQTFKPGTMANIHRQVRNDELTKNELTAPHPSFSHLK